VGAAPPWPVHAACAGSVCLSAHCPGDRFSRLSVRWADLTPQRSQGALVGGASLTPGSGGDECGVAGPVSRWGRVAPSVAHDPSPLRSTSFPVDASTRSFGGPPRLHPCHPRDAWLVRPDSTGTCPLQEAPRSAWRNNDSDFSGVRLRCESSFGCVLITLPDCWKRSAQWG
jgi:hypothetical protein